MYVPALGYRWLTPYYDAVVGVTTREKTFKRALIRQANVQSGQRVLDLACGTGTLAIWIKEAVADAEIIGVDGDPAILQFAIRKAEQAAVAVRFDAAMSFSLPYTETYFDCAVSSLFFHHLSWQDKKRTVAEVFRVLRPGGQLHVADWGKAGSIVMRVLFAFVQLLDGFSNTRDNVRGKLVELFEEEGFVDVTETTTFSTICGTMALYSAVKPA
jgi:ubiquinone/menaquinone biosynthesis C-methylase UbiE